MTRSRRVATAASDRLGTRYHEELYRQVMRLHAAAGRGEDVDQTLRLLEARLLDLDAEPDSATSALVHLLCAAAQPGPARPVGGSRPARRGSAQRASGPAERG